MEFSAGMILFRRAQEFEFLLLKQVKSGTWSFPKGHIEQGETAWQAARREVSEETGLCAEPLVGFCEDITYSTFGDSVKTVTLYIAEADGDLSLSDEIGSFAWVTRAEAEKLLTRPRYAEILRAAESFLRNHFAINCGSGGINHAHI